MDQQQQQQQQQEGVRDLSMELTDDEKQRALSIKAAVESSEYIKPLTDFEYAYLAIACHAYGKTLAQILDVAYKLQCFREMYKLSDNPQEGTSLVQGIMQLQPGFVLDVSYLPSEQCYTMSFDYAAMKFNEIKTDAQWKVFMGGWYYIMWAGMTNFQSMRNGIVVLSECEGMDFSNFDYSSTERTLVEFASYFPWVVKEMVWLNAPTVASMIYSMAKRMLSKEFMDTWKLQGAMAGYDGRLDALFHMPTPEIADQHLLSRIEMYLQQRYHNEQTFSL